VRFPPGGGIGLPLEVIALLCSDGAEMAVAERRANHVALGKIRKPIEAWTDIGDYLIPTIRLKGSERNHLIAIRMSTAQYASRY
jgi:hypothetical protein